MSDEADKLLRQYADPLTPEDFRNPALHPQSVNPFQLPPRAPRQTVENIHRPDDPFMVQAREYMGADAAARGGYALGKTAAETAKMAKEGDWWGVAGNMPEIAAIFAGPKAKTANLDKLGLARAMEKLLHSSPDAIRNETGWFRGADKQWRFEIDDSKSAFKPDIPWSVVPDAMSHDALYAAYPHLRDVGMKRLTDTNLRGERSYNGYFDPEKNYIAVHDELGRTGGRSTMLHELQHAIQEHEGFAQGNNPVRAAWDIAQAKLDREELSAKTQRMQNAHGDEARAIMQRAEQGDPDAIKFREEAIKAWAPRLGFRSKDNPYGLDVDQMIAARIGEGDGIYNRAISKYNDAYKWALMNPHDVYKKTAGEVEARNVQKRRDMTALERDLVPPWETQDTPTTQQILELYTKGPGTKRD